MNGWPRPSCISPLNNQYDQGLLSNHGGNKTAVSSPSQGNITSVSPYYRLHMFHAQEGSPAFNREPVLCTTTLPSPTLTSSASPFYHSLPQVSCASSFLRPGSFPHFTPGPRPMTQASPPVFSSLPSMENRDSSRSSRRRRNSLPPRFPTPSAPMENQDSSIGFKQNHSSLPPRVPVTEPNPVVVSGSNALPPRKSHKRTNSDIIGINSTVPQSYFEVPDLVGGDSSCDKDGPGELIYDDQTMKDFCCEFMNVDYNTNAAKGHENVDDSLVISISDLGGGNNTNEKTAGPSTTSGVKRRAGKEIDELQPSSGNLFKAQVSSTNSADGNENAINVNFGNGQYTDSELMKIAGSPKLLQFASDPKRVKRILANRESARRSKERKMLYIEALERRVQSLKVEIESLASQLAVLEEDKAVLMNEKKEMSLRIDSLEKQAQFREELKNLEVAALKEQVRVEAERVKKANAVIEQLSAQVQRLKVATGEVMQNHGQFDSLNMQSLEPNMFQQPDINQFNQPQPNPDFYGQLNQPQPNPDLYGQFNQAQPKPDYYGQN